jgi:hypothetical protein
MVLQISAPSHLRSERMLKNSATVHLRAERMLKNSALVELRAERLLKSSAMAEFRADRMLKISAMAHQLVCQFTPKERNGPSRWLSIGELNQPAAGSSGTVQGRDHVRILAVEVAPTVAQEDVPRPNGAPLGGQRVDTKPLFRSPRNDSAANPSRLNRR